MNIPDIDFSQVVDADAQLQQELRSMFAIDTQSYLQRYSQIAGNLQVASWQIDIQELYRCIHTIKGGAVTVGAEAALQVATALEDVLSDLRYLEPAPPLADQHLSQLLLECGELLTVALEKPLAETAPIFNRIQILHQEVRNRYLPQWNQLKQCQQEFAEQGFDLVVLELEIALEHLPLQGQVPDNTVQIAQTVLGQLQQIGQELQLTASWTNLLEQAQILFAYPTNAVWRTQWLRLFQVLKSSAKQGDDPIAFEFEDFDQIEQAAQLELPPMEANWVEMHLPEITQTETQSRIAAANLDALDITALDITIPDKPDAENAEEVLDTEIGDWLDHLMPLDEHLNLPEAALPDSLDAPDLAWVTPELIALDSVTPEPIVPTEAEPTPIKSEPVSAPEKVQIPVALEKLDQSAESLIETLLALRTSQGLQHTLQNQVTQLVMLAQEGVQYITHLRQLQDEYALLDQLNDRVGPTPERYRQGYTVINRLLETSLRLSEIGAEAGKTSQQVAESFQRIDRNVVKLQTTIEDSRLVPFQNLSFRAKVILRELTTRCAKPAQLIIQGEQTELDVSIARALEPVLLHLIRNAYDHGLESPSERIAQGKSAEGTITLALQRQGNQFQLHIRDDGRGIDAAMIQARAEALKLPLTQTQTSAELLAVICQAGFSSQTQVNEISGRGIGMDIVAAQVARLGGRLEVQTAPGIGTAFQLTFPVPRLLVPCLLLQTGNHVFAIPSDDIKTIMLFSSLQPSLIEQADPMGWQVTNAPEPTLVLDALNYWQPQSLHRAVLDTAVCLHIGSTPVPETTAAPQQELWLLADELLDQAELIISPLPSPLVPPEGLMGVNLQPNGCLIPVFEAKSLAKRLLTAPTPAETITAGIATPRSSDAVPPGHSILIVDDAALMRRRIEASLTAYGYSTHTCADGQEAWNWLQAHPQPDLIITDIEMPNMDGFTLIERCRNHGITVPILVVSSRLSEEWSNEAHRLGATDYLTKGFSTVELLKKVNKFCQQNLNTEQKL